METANKLQNTLLAVADSLEKQIDDEIEVLDNMNVSELEQLRAERLKALKKESEQRHTWRKNGHGVYTILAEEKHFFDTIKKSEKVVCHFYQDSSERCKIVDMHLKILAQSHLETRFVSLCAPKCPFLTDKLKVKVLPTILLVINQQVVDRIVGFTDLGNCDDFSTRMMEWRLACTNVIDYDGDVRVRPDEKKKKINIIQKSKKNIRETESDDDLSDEDFHDDVKM